MIGPTPWAVDPNLITTIGLSVILVMALVGVANPQLVQRFGPRVRPVGDRRLVFVRSVNLLVAVLCVVFTVVRL